MPEESIKNYLLHTIKFVRSFGLTKCALLAFLCANAIVCIALCDSINITRFWHDISPTIFMLLDQMRPIMQIC